MSHLFRCRPLFSGPTFHLFAASDLFVSTVALRLGLLLARRHVTYLCNRTKHKTHNREREKRERERERERKRERERER